MIMHDGNGVHRQRSGPPAVIMRATSGRSAGCMITAEVHDLYRRGGRVLGGTCEDRRNAGPSEFLGAIAVRERERIWARNRALIAANLGVFHEFFARHADLFEWTAPDGGCVAFPRYLGAEGVEAFCQDLVETEGVLLLPASIFASDLASVPADRFRLGVGRRDPMPALAAVDRRLSRRRP
ncbi:MAG TPA: hypothetical protein VI248_04715 [Kineosporiaceae bacterium]